MSADLIERLRDSIQYMDDSPGRMLAEAADTIEALTRDIAMRPSGLTALYEVREAMGYNKLTSLDILARDCQSARRVLSGAPIPPDRGLLDLAEDVMRRLKETQAEVLNYRTLYEAGRVPRRCDTNVVGAAGECLACDAEQGVNCLAKASA